MNKKNDSILGGNEAIPIDLRTAIIKAFSFDGIVDLPYPKKLQKSDNKISINLLIEYCIEPDFYEEVDLLDLTRDKKYSSLVNFLDSLVFKTHTPYKIVLFKNAS